MPKDEHGDKSVKSSSFFPHKQFETNIENPLTFLSAQCKTLSIPCKGRACTQLSLINCSIKQPASHLQLPIHFIDSVPINDMLMAGVLYHGTPLFILHSISMFPLQISGIG